MSTLSLTDIESTTAIHDFPDIHNGNNTKIEDKVTEIEKEITDLKANYTDEIKKLQNTFTSLYSSLEADMDKKLSNELSDSYLYSQINTLITNKLNALYDKLDEKIEMVNDKVEKLK